jgi:hypothetical protein
MSTTGIVILVVAVVLIAAGSIFIFQRQRTKRLRAKFGPEYDRAVETEGNRLKAEQTLAKREKRVKNYQIRPLQTVHCERFRQSWRDVQSGFVDDPKTALTEADRLVQEVMKARGYPIDDFEQCAADLSVDHPVVVENYRAGHVVAVRHGRGQATTEDLRRAMIYYRTLFDDLLEEAPIPEERVRVKRASA